MDCSILGGIRPTLARLPRGLALLLILSLVLQMGALPARHGLPPLLPLPMAPERWHRLARRGARLPFRWHARSFLAACGLRLLARELLLLGLLHLSGAWAWTPAGRAVLLLPRAADGRDRVDPGLSPVDAPPNSESWVACAPTCLPTDPGRARRQCGGAPVQSAPRPPDRIVLRGRSRHPTG